MAALCAWLSVAFMHARGYFLLADDHALVAEAQRDLRDIFSTGLFGVYRPLGFLVARLAGYLDPTPVGWSAVILLLHACNAALVGGLATRLGSPLAASVPAALMFLWSPWSSEAYLWFSGVFDVGATFGVLVAAVALTMPGGSRAREAVAMSAAVLGCLVAAGFKENGYLAAAIVPALALSGRSQPPRRRVILVAVLAAACVAAVFSYRTSLLASSNTPYNVSEFGGRLLAWTAIPAAASNLRGLLLWPVPAVWGDASRLLATLLIWPLGAMLTATMVLLALGRARAWLQLVALGLAIVLTASHHIAIATITPRRYLYLAGVPLSLLMSSALAARAERNHDAPTAPLPLVLAGLLLAAGLAGASQAALWGRVTATARCAVEDFGRKVVDTRTTPVYVENMPFAVDHGPFVLLDYDFTYAYRGRWQGADVAVRNAVLTLDRTGHLAVQWYGAPPPDAERRTPVSLDLCLGQPK